MPLFGSVSSSAVPGRGLFIPHKVITMKTTQAISTMNAPTVNPAREFWLEGLSYQKVCQNGWPGKRIFTAEIIYQLSAMAIEKFFMAWLTQERALPENHTLRDLVRAAEKLRPLPPELRKSLLRMDRFMDLCPLVPLNIPKPDASHVPEFIDTMARSMAWLGGHVSPYTKGCDDK